MNHIATPSRAGVIALATALLLLTPGCSLLPTAVEPTPGLTGDSSAPATQQPPPTDEATPAPVDLSFGSGPGLEPVIASIDWADPFAASDRFQIESPDDGNGTWSYIDTANQCAIRFYQGSVTDLTAGTDDRATTDTWLLLMNQGDPGISREIIAQYAEDAEIPLWGDEGGVEVRRFGGQANDGSSFTESARYFSALDFGLYVLVSCPAERNSYDEYDELLGEYLAVLVVTTA